MFFLANFAIFSIGRRKKKHCEISVQHLAVINFFYMANIQRGEKKIASGQRVWFILLCSADYLFKHSRYILRNYPQYIQHIYTYGLHKPTTHGWSGGWWGLNLLKNMRMMHDLNCAIRLARTRSPLWYIHTHMCTIRINAYNSQ